MTTNPSDLLDPIAESACEVFGVSVKALRNPNRKPRFVVAARRMFILLARAEVVRDNRYVTRHPDRPRHYATRDEQPDWRPISSKDLAWYLWCDHSTVIGTMKRLGITKAKEVA